ncbi:hypothetical protein AB6A40_000039 [Gnathostoma spinigerum]|uniref:Secreted protein n=1 Tax=Gnathostoma spinigerum TaxID=75299 RepID=A0ABD6E2A2_9BILA
MVAVGWLGARRLVELFVWCWTGERAAVVPSGMPPNVAVVVAGLVSVHCDGESPEGLSSSIVSSLTAVAFRSAGGRVRCVMCSVDANLKSENRAEMKSK